jgi:putative hydrolase of the HAD superfamily|tara:strand:- start:26 stop:679 length:654 start_codon:yes stop_codon:yes gene_type:complete
MINWSDIETVLLDMDGTLLDLRFDNHFWQRVVPDYFANKEGISFDEAIKQLEPLFKAQEGLLNWYCLDYWSEALGIDIVKLKVETQEHIKELPHTRDFLGAIKASGKRCVLVTNAHAESLNLKMQKTGLVEFFDAIVSAHDFGYPKEQQSFWHAFQQLEQFDKSKTVMVDDSLSVLKAADTFGIQYIVAITKPDSAEPPRIVHDYLAVESLGAIQPK